MLNSLYIVSQKSGVPLYSLRKANNKWDNSLYPGQKLLLPGKTEVSASGNAVIPFTESDVDLPARLITAEAENQPYDAKVGVGAVVVNRVQSG